MTLNGVTHTEKEPAGKALLETCKSIKDKTDKPIGEYTGFKMPLSFDSFSHQFKLLLRGNTDRIQHETAYRRRLPRFLSEKGFAGAGCR